MDKATGKRILEYIRRKQPVKLADLLADLNIDKEDYYAATLLLRHDGNIISAGRHGIFAGTDAYEKWRAKKGL